MALSCANHGVGSSLRPAWTTYFLIVHSKSDNPVCPLRWLPFSQCHSEPVMMQKQFYLKWYLTAAIDLSHEAMPFDERYHAPFCMLFRAAPYVRASERINVWSQLYQRSVKATKRPITTGAHRCTHATGARLFQKIHRQSNLGTAFTYKSKMKTASLASRISIRMALS